MYNGKKTIIEKVPLNPICERIDDDRFEETLAERINSQGAEKVVLSDRDILRIRTLGEIFNPKQLADYLGINLTTFQNICVRQPEVLRQYRMGKQDALLDSWKVIKNAIRNEGDVSTARWHLERQAGWSETKNLNITNDDGSLANGFNVVFVKEVKELSREEITGGKIVDDK